MKKIILAYNFTPDRLSGVKRSAVSVKASVKVVGKEEYGQKLGFLAGVQGYTAHDALTEGSFDDEMLLMCGFENGDIDTFIKALRKHGVGKVGLKAILTQTNVEWNSTELYEAIMEDHREIQRRALQHGQQ